jgi:hypothetical protein
MVVAPELCEGMTGQRLTVESDWAVYRKAWRMKVGQKGTLCRSRAGGGFRQHVVPMLQGKFCS